MVFNCIKATEPLRGGSLLFTTKSPGYPGTHLIDLTTHKVERLSWPQSPQWYWTWDPWTGNPVTPQPPPPPPPPPPLRCSSNVAVFAPNTAVLGTSSGPCTRIWFGNAKGTTYVLGVMSMLITSPHVPNQTIHLVRLLDWLGLLNCQG